MKQFLLVLKFELVTMFQKKSFLISTILVALSAFVLLSIPRFISDSDDKGEDKVDTADKSVMVIYDQQQVFQNKEILDATFPTYKITFVDNLDEVKKQVKSEKADAGFEVKNETSFLYYVNNSSLNDHMEGTFQQAMSSQYQTTQLNKKGYDTKAIQEIYATPISSSSEVLGTDGISNYFYTYVLIMILYIMIMLYGNQIGVGVASEKSNRAIEILTTSCSSNALIFGKVIAGAIAGFVQTAIMIGSVLVAYQMNIDVWDHALDRYISIPTEVLLVFALFGILGYLLYSFLYGAIGALVSKTEEVNGATLPIQILIIISFFLAMIMLQTPDSIIAKIASYVPFTSCMCMFVNVAMGSVSIIEIIISLAILAATTVFMGMLGAKLYRRGTLSYGNSVKLKNMIKMMKQKD